MSDSTIRAVFFDLGMVLVTFSWEIAIPRWANANGGDKARLRAFLEHPYHEAFERSELTGEEFSARGRELTGFQGADDVFKATWNEIFTEVPSSVRVLRRIAGRLPMYLLSNTNPWHAAYLETKFDWMQLFEKRFYSCDLGVRKPDPRIYQMALGHAGVPAEHALFFDDRMENVIGAQRVGMRAVQVPTPAALPELAARCLPEIFKNEHSQ